MRERVPDSVSGVAGLSVCMRLGDGFHTGSPTRVARGILAALGMTLAAAGAGCASSPPAASAMPSSTLGRTSGEMDLQNRPAGSGANHGPRQPIGTTRTPSGRW